MVLKQQSNSLQEGPRCNPFAANGRGWSKGGCTHDSEENHRALLPTLCLPWTGFQAQGLPAHAWDTPGPTQQPSPSLARDAALPSTAGHEAPRAPHQTKDQGSCWTARSFPPWGWPWGMFCLLVRAGPCGLQPLAQQALSLQMVAGVDFGMLHLKLRGQKGQEEHRVTNVMLKQQLQAPGLILLLKLEELRTECAAQLFEKCPANYVLHANGERAWRHWERVTSGYKVKCVWQQMCKSWNFTAIHDGWRSQTTSTEKLTPTEGKLSAGRHKQHPG